MGSSGLDRRNFLKQVAAWSAGAALAAPIFSMPSALRAQAAGEPPVTGTGAKPVVIVAKGKDYAALVSTAIAKLGGIEQFVRPGNKVVVKPNIGWDRNPEQAANTHPEVVAAIAKLCLDARAGSVQIFDRSCNDARRCYSNSGIQAAIEALGDSRATCPHIEDRKFIPVKIASGKSVTEWDLYKDAVEADCYINVPIAKHHGLSKLTLGMKNVMGVCGGSRGKIHQEIAQKLADLNTVIRPKLTIIDATRILLRNGPQGGNLADVKVLDTIIVSIDPVAADAYATTLFGMKPDEIASTVAAYEMGLGEMDLSKISIIEV